MENMAVNLLFTPFAVAVAGLLLANIIITVLRLTNRRDVATRIARSIAPIVSYLRLGGKSDADIGSL